MAVTELKFRDVVRVIIHLTTDGPEPHRICRDYDGWDEAVKFAQGAAVAAYAAGDENHMTFYPAHRIRQVDCSKVRIRLLTED